MRESGPLKSIRLIILTSLSNWDYFDYQAYSLKGLYLSGNYDTQTISFYHKKDTIYLRGGPY